MLYKFTNFTLTLGFLLSLNNVVCNAIIIINRKNGEDCNRKRLSPLEMWLNRIYVRAVKLLDMFFVFR